MFTGNKKLLCQNKRLDVTQLSPVLSDPETFELLQNRNNWSELYINFTSEQQEQQDQKFSGCEQFQILLKIEMLFPDGSCLNDDPQDLQELLFATKMTELREDECERGFCIFRIISVGDQRQPRAGR